MPPTTWRPIEAKKIRTLKPSSSSNTATHPNSTKAANCQKFPASREMLKFASQAGTSSLINIFCTCAKIGHHYCNILGISLLDLPSQSAIVNCSSIRSCNYFSTTSGTNKYEWKNSLMAPISASYQALILVAMSWNTFTLVTPVYVKIRVNLTIEVTSATLAPEKNLYSAYEKCFTLQRLVGRIICGTTAQMCKSQANVPVCFLTRNFSDFQSLSSSSETYRKINQLSPIILTFPFKCS